jgi:hypothetical protein
MLGRGFEPMMFFYYLCATKILRLVPNSYSIKIKTKTSKVLLTYVVTYFKHTCLCMYVCYFHRSNVYNIECCKAISS